VIKKGVYTAYQEMGADRVAESEALDWAEGVCGDAANPTPATQRTFDATDAGRDLVVCKDADDMFKKLGKKRGRPC